MRILKIIKIIDDCFILEFSSGKIGRWSVSKAMSKVEDLEEYVKPENMEKAYIREEDGAMVLHTGIDICPSSMEYTSEEV
jgi:hypothetical protein